MAKVAILPTIDNGNLTQDPYKDLTIGYNFLNLPDVVSKASGGQLSIAYDAAGVKLRKTVVDGSNSYTQDYVGGIEYKEQKMEAIYNEEGRLLAVDLDNNGTRDLFRFEWVIRDHLGNTRVMFSDLDGDGKIESDPVSGVSELLQENHYRPFGMEMEGPWDAVSGETKENHYQYGGKELNGDLGLNWMDFGGRWYMADLCRWGQVDPLAEQGYSRTPYHYVRNNPLAFVDPTGLGEDPAPLPGATVYSEENANRKQRKEAYDEWQRERDREYGLSSPSQQPSETDNDEECCSGVDIKTRMQMAGMLAKQNEDSQAEWFEQLTQIEGNAALQAGEIVAGAIMTEYLIVKLIQGGKWAWIAYQLNRATNTIKPLPRGVQSMLNLLKPQNADEAVTTLYRGTTGSEGTGQFLFLTDDATVAASYAKNNGQVVQYNLSSTALYQLRQRGALEVLNDINATTSIRHNTFKFVGKDLKNALNTIATPLK